MNPTQTSASPRELQNFVGGRFTAATGPEWIEDVNPATGEVLARLPRSGAAEVAAAVGAAKNALEGPWADFSVEQRARLLEEVAERIEGRLEQLAELESQDTGKPLQLARSVDIPRAVANFRFFAGAVRHLSGELHPMDGALNYTLRRPLGVAALITPWNLPLYLLTWKAAPALAMGSTVVAKPSELTPLTAHALAEIFAEVGVPDGVFNLVHGLGPEAGQALVEHPDVAGISFTGGTATGRTVATAAAPTFKKLSLELGGKNPTLVFADADVDEAARGAARAGFLNQGQICLCGSRIFVEKDIYEAFVKELVKAVKMMKLGDPSDPATDLGSLVSQEHREKVERYLQLAQEEGGTLECGGGRPFLSEPFSAGAFLEPAVITGLPPDCRTAQEEIFGPVVTVHPFEDEKEALASANSVRYGLSASVWTRDLDRAHRVAAALETGMVWVNTWLLRDLRVPFGGMKESGLGREGGVRSLDFFSEARNVCIKLN